MVDKNLFLYDLSVVAILKNEGPYLKEWLDYHLLAGVDHFYLYDNNSTDNQAEVAKPYVEAGLVDYFFKPGKAMQFASYNDAIKNFKFQSRYMAFIDGDEFIYPKKVAPQGSIMELVDEILSQDPKASGMSIHWHCFGTNGEEKADFSRGVLERFTRRAKSDWMIPRRNKPENRDAPGNCYVKDIVNPRKINFNNSPHRMVYFADNYIVDENAKLSEGSRPLPVITEKILINHYYLKSREEFLRKVDRGSSARTVMKKKLEWFEQCDRNEEFDDDILKYRDARAKIYQKPDDSHAAERLFNALAANLSPTLVEDMPPSFYAGKMETFLTCRAVSSHFKAKLTDNNFTAFSANFFEEASLFAILKSLDEMTLGDAQLLIRDLPNILSLPYPVVKELRDEIIKRLPKIKEELRLTGLLQEYVELDYLQDMFNLKE